MIKTQTNQTLGRIVTSILWFIRQFDLRHYSRSSHRHFTKHNHYVLIILLILQGCTCQKMSSLLQQIFPLPACRSLLAQVFIPLVIKLLPFRNQSLCVAYVLKKLVLICHKQGVQLNQTHLLTVLLSVPGEYEKLICELSSPDFIDVL